MFLQNLTGDTEADSRVKDREDLPLPGTVISNLGTTKLIDDIFSGVLLGLIVSYLSIRILVTLNGD